MLKPVFTLSTAFLASAVSAKAPQVKHDRFNGTTTVSVQAGKLGGKMPAILLGAAVAWAYWHFILTRVIDRPGGSNKRFVLYTALLGFLGLLCFLYPIRYVARGSISDVLQGVFMAFVVVGVVAYLIWVVARLLNAPPPTSRAEDEEEF
jgi:hypothetical protein